MGIKMSAPLQVELDERGRLQKCGLLHSQVSGAHPDPARPTHGQVPLHGESRGDPGFPLERVHRALRGGP